MGGSILYPLSYFILRGERGQLLGPGAPWGPRVGPRGPGDPQGTPGNWLLGSTQPLVRWKQATLWLVGSTQPLVGWKHATLWLVCSPDSASPGPHFLEKIEIFWKIVGLFLGPLGPPRGHKMGPGTPGIDFKSKKNSKHIQKFGPEVSTIFEILIFGFWDIFLMEI